MEPETWIAHDNCTVYIMVIRYRPCSMDSSINMYGYVKEYIRLCRCVCAVWQYEPAAGEAETINVQMLSHWIKVCGGVPTFTYLFESFDMNAFRKRA